MGAGKRMKFTFGLMVVSWALVGCGADCAKMCEDSKKCADASAAAKAVDCEKTCEDAEKTAEGAGCESQYESLLDCEDEQDDICRVTADCDKEFDALAQCMTR
jgi:hypothetical protein